MWLQKNLHNNQKKIFFKLICFITNLTNKIKTQAIIGKKIELVFHVLQATKQSILRHQYTVYDALRAFSMHCKQLNNTFTEYSNILSDLKFYDVLLAFKVLGARPSNESFLSSGSQLDNKLMFYKDPLLARCLHVSSQFCASNEWSNSV